jgi:hypothetical protein
MAIYNHSKAFVASLTANHRNALRVLITTELKQLRHELQMSNVAVMSEEDRKLALAKQGRTIELFPEELRRPMVVDLKPLDMHVEVSR